MGEAGRRLTSFVPPQPNRLVIGAMAPVNRVLMLKGIPGLRDIPLLNRIPGIRGLANVRHIDFPKSDEARLASVCGPGKASFFTPNHPEFFTDWMIDKEIVSRVAPLAAAWATNGIVNGMGKWGQKFWLANNLIAQIPGNSQAARDHSVSWALQGHGVLLHPEGAVGWHGDWVAPLMPGSAEMALQALRQAGAGKADISVWIAPIAWKLAFLHDVDDGLKRECAYVEGHMGLPAAQSSSTPAERIFAIYAALLARDEEKAGVHVEVSATIPERLDALTQTIAGELATLIGFDRTSEDRSELLKAARRRLREQGAERNEASKRIAETAETLQRLQRLGPFAWASPVMTQEQAAEHLKRIRNDYCFGTWRDTLNRLIPQPVGPRRVHIRVAEPIAVRNDNRDADAITNELGHRLQASLDAINGELRAANKVRTYPNPFVSG